MGLVNRVVEPGELDAFMASYLGRIVENAPLTIAASKLIIAQIAKDPAQRDMTRCREAVVACDSSADFVEGRRAFMEKRKPVFEGR
jgi:enoyl-CoA hydratase/carnithine racemase